MCLHFTSQSCWGICKSLPYPLPSPGPQPRLRETAGLTFINGSVCLPLYLSTRSLMSLIIKSLTCPLKSECLTLLSLFYSSCLTLRRKHVKTKTYTSCVPPQLSWVSFSKIGVAGTSFFNFLPTFECQVIITQYYSQLKITDVVCDTDFRGLPFHSSILIPWISSK